MTREELDAIRLEFIRPEYMGVYNSGIVLALFDEVDRLEARVTDLDAKVESAEVFIAALQSHYDSAVLSNIEFRDALELARTEIDRLVAFVDRSHVLLPDLLLKAEAMGECASAADVYFATALKREGPKV